MATKPTPPTFAQAVEKIPGNTTTGTGKGLTISLLKALTHASLIRATEPAEYLQLPVAEEIKAISEHLGRERLLHPPFGTTDFNAMLDALHDAGDAIAAEQENWDEAKTKENLSLLIDRILTICRAMDMELAGIHGPETGDHL